MKCTECGYNNPNSRSQVVIINGVPYSFCEKCDDYFKLKPKNNKYNNILKFISEFISEALLTFRVIGILLLIPLATTLVIIGPQIVRYIVIRIIFFMPPQMIGIVLVISIVTFIVFITIKCISKINKAIEKYFDNF